MRILKFGGSSLATPATIRGVGRILLDARRQEPVVAVVSAFQGVTNQLLECARLAERSDAQFATVFDDIAPDVWRPTGKPRVDYWPRRLEDVPEPGVSGVFANHRVARMAHRAPQKVERLLAAAGNQNFVEFRRNTVATQVTLQVFFERWVAVARAVLENHRPFAA